MQPSERPKGIVQIDHVRITRVDDWTVVLVPKIVPCEASAAMGRCLDVAKQFTLRRLPLSVDQPSDGDSGVKLKALDRLAVPSVVDKSTFQGEISPLLPGRVVVNERMKIMS